MTVPITSNRIPHVATEGQTLFPFPFSVYAATDLVVYADGALLTLGVHYNITGVGSPSGGNVVLVSGASAGVVVVILCQLPLSQETSYQPSNPFPAKAHETALDRQVKIAQQLQEQIARSLRLAPHTTSLTPSVDAPTPAAFIRWSGDGMRLESALEPPTSVDLTSYRLNLASTALRTMADRLSDQMNAKDFGFLPSNTAAQNSAAWAAMIDALPSGGVTIHLSPGAYHHHGLVIDRHNLTLANEGTAGPTIRAQLICDDPTVSSLMILNAFRVTLQGIWVGHSVASDGGTAAIHAQGYASLVLRDVSTNLAGLPGSHTGLILGATATTDSFEALIHACEFVLHAGDGIRLEGVDSTHRVGETVITATRLYTNLGAGVRIKDYVYGTYLRDGLNIGISNGYGIKIEPSVNDGRTKDVFIGPGCIVDGSSLDNIHGTNLDSVHIIGNWIASAGASPPGEFWGIVADEPTTGWEIKANFIMGNNGGGVYVAGTQTHVTGNYFLGNGAQAASAVGLYLHGTASGISYGENKYLNHDVSWLDNNPTANCPGLQYAEGEGQPRLPAGVSFDGSFAIGFLGSSPLINFDAQDFLLFNRTTNTMSLSVGNNALFSAGPGVTSETSIMVWDFDTGSLKRAKMHTMDQGAGTRKYLYLDT